MKGTRIQATVCITQGCKGPKGQSWVGVTLPDFMSHRTALRNHVHTKNVAHVTNLVMHRVWNHSATLDLVHNRTAGALHAKLACRDL